MDIAIQTFMRYNATMLQQPQLAGKVTGLRIDIAKHEASIEGDTKEVLENLVAQYEKLFGKASREVYRDAVRPLLSQVPENEIPAVLK